MKTAIVTGACSVIGQAVVTALAESGYVFKQWCRHSKIDLKVRETLPVVTSVDVVVHVAEVGVEGLYNVGLATEKALVESPWKGVFIGLSSIHHLKNDDAYARSKRAQEATLLHWAKGGRMRSVVLRLGHIVGTKTWPVEDAARLVDIPLRRFGTPADVAQAVMFIANAPWLTGSVITLDGGISCL